MPFIFDTNIVTPLINKGDITEVVEKNYINLTNKPSINGIILNGNKTGEDLGLAVDLTDYVKKDELNNATVHKYGIKGDYSTQYGILECPNGILKNPNGKKIILQPQVVLQCAGTESKTIITGPLEHDIQSNTDIDIFYSSGQLLECENVFYQTNEPEDGEESFIAWWNPEVEIWKFKSNDTGNVFREAVACRIAHLHVNETNITRIDYIGNRILDDKIFLEKPSVLTDNATEITIDKTVPSTAYVYGTITSLTIEEVEKSTVETTIEFIAGDTIAVSYPLSLQTVGNTTFKAGKKYILAIYNNIMAIGELN